MMWNELLMKIKMAHSILHRDTGVASCIIYVVSQTAVGHSVNGVLSSLFFLLFEWRWQHRANGGKWQGYDVGWLSVFFRPRCSRGARAASSTLACLRRERRRKMRRKSVTSSGNSSLRAPSLWLWQWWRHSSSSNSNKTGTAKAVSESLLEE